MTNGCGHRCVRLFGVFSLLGALFASLMLPGITPQQGVLAAPPGALGPPVVTAAVKHDTSAPLRDLVASPSTSTLPRARPLRPTGGSGSNSPDGAVQSSAKGPKVGTTPGLSFPGVGQGDYSFSDNVAPPDTEGAVGLTQYVQWVNTSFAVFDKTTGAIVQAPRAGNTFWAGFGGDCQNLNDGDPIIEYDSLANRWVATQFAVSNGTTTGFLQCIAVSTTSDATGSYNRYVFNYGTNAFNDYGKLGIWPDAYYASYNIFNGPGTSFTGPMACAFDRAKMIAGQAATQQCFQLLNSFSTILPSDLTGTNPPPVGSPNFYFGLGANSLNEWQFHVDFTTPANTTFTGPTNIPVTAFTNACNTSVRGACIPQPSTTTVLESLGDRPMYRVAYRHFTDGHESLVLDHAVVAGTSVGVRWYEIRTPLTPTVYQQSTYAPDANYRWMGNLAMDKAGNIALGYSVSSSTVNPSIRYTGRLATDTLNTMQTEATLQGGGGAQNAGLERWGDYSAMTVDPVDGCTFFYTNEYLKATGSFNWSTRVDSFKFPSCGAVAISSLSPISVPAGNPTFTLTVNGSGFVSGATVLFNGAARTTTFVSATQLTATIPASDVAARGTPQITVRKPDASVSNAYGLFVFTPFANPSAGVGTLGPTLYAYVRGLDNGVYVDPTNNGSNYAGYAKVADGASTTPAAAPLGGRLELALRGLDNNLYLNATPDGYNYLGFISVGAGTCGAPALATLGSTLYIFACGLDNNLYFNTTTDGSTFGGWRGFGSGVVASVPAVTVIGGTLYVAVRGLDNNIYVNSTPDGVNFAGWRSVPSGAVPAAPSLAGLNGVLYLSVQGADNNIYVNSSLDGGYTWRNWYGPGVNAITAAPSLGVVNNTLVVLARGQDGNAYANTTYDGYNFNGWHSLFAGGRPTPAGSQGPTAVSGAPAPSAQSGLTSAPGSVKIAQPGGAIAEPGKALPSAPTVAKPTTPPGGTVKGTAFPTGPTTAQPATTAPTLPVEASAPVAKAPAPPVVVTAPVTTQPVIPAPAAATAPTTGSGASSVAFAPVTPFTDSADHRFFSQTNHSISFGFKSYWEANGSVALLGLPISEEFAEQGADGRTHTVQYFERARLEYHPEFKGTPFETELGLLAREVTVGRASDPAFQPVSAEQAPAGGVYYSETGHTLGAPFTTFWETKGGLTAFGYPISEPMQEKNADTGQTYTVQYFERYRMEYHPDTGGIELGRLGVEVAQQRGNLPH